MYVYITHLESFLDLYTWQRFEEYCRCTYVYVSMYVCIYYTFGIIPWYVHMTKVWRILQMHVRVCKYVCMYILHIWNHSLICTLDKGLKNAGNTCMCMYVCAFMYVYVTHLESFLDLYICQTVCLSVGLHVLYILIHMSVCLSAYLFMSPARPVHNVSPGRAIIVSLPLKTCVLYACICMHAYI